jgi:hypothetical protein
MTAQKPVIARHAPLSPVIARQLVDQAIQKITTKSTANEQYRFLEQSIIILNINQYEQFS